MPMKNPPHPGLSVRQNCLDPSRPERDRGSSGAGSCAAYAFASIERPRGDFARHGHSPGEGRIVKRRLLVEPPDRIRSGSGAQG